MSVNFYKLTSSPYLISPIINSSHYESSSRISYCFISWNTLNGTKWLSLKESESKRAFFNYVNLLKSIPLACIIFMILYFSSLKTFLLYILSKWPILLLFLLAMQLCTKVLLSLISLETGGGMYLILCFGE